MTGLSGRGCIYAAYRTERYNRLRGFPTGVGVTTQYASGEVSATLSP